ncbi:RagB/SusD family nutrient uptake outer membrane protein [Sphingobacterium sp. DK4209]|uniref:RagB/SusD family nutrient uptake outer membrane protein n=1 Tax=Sphingobacterium zhuxiongii TaxID=2662364 RepID=A0A5Q0QC66_9SPHI|nr:MULTISPECIES: RagB/SusD family nutrient uptake outer membrane protein [unclassified Sphingobacterium]MVZ65357.1 RagB/SusD family nutrient uptake outer membrane protein [Sphingobacterium sp. DK4209]QGA26441.1 RagB/SusD family nutrient uptake outer membrane protein [Sphingobacterium sp. dk4302]
MKILKITLYTFVATLLLQSCKDDGFLDRFPKDAFSEPTFFKTEDDLLLYANGFYDNLPAITNYSEDNNSDVMVPRSINDLLAGTYVIPNNGGGWATGDWQAIRQCNYFLTRYSQANTTNKEIYAGEVRFFRALFYWQKVERFGDVPLVIKDLDETSEELFGPRVNRNEVMDFVLEDLKFAVENLPAKGTQKAGRLNKDVARALLSRVGLWEGTFRKYHALGNHTAPLEASVQASLDLMAANSGYKLYTTGDPTKDYYNLFIQQDLSNNPENILNRAYILNISTQGYSRTATENNTGVSKSFVEQYLFTDGKPKDLTSFTYDESSPLKEHLNRDPRYAQTIATPNFIWQFNSSTSTPTGLPAIGTSRTSTGYWLIKGRSSDAAQYIANQSDIDAFIFRFGEVLLNFAEAKYELDGTISQTDLDRSINLLRARVGMPKLLTTVANDVNGVDYGYSIAPLLREIRRERQVELIGEGQRWKDILRWKAGKLIESAKSILGMKLDANLKAEYVNQGKDINAIETNADGYIIVYPSVSGGKRVWNNKNYYYPLPIDQITLAKYTQNPGW